jgi:hypothetical protein
MSVKLDLFIEKIVSRMNLDDDQRAEVVREFRAHLEEAIDQRIAQGISPELAEHEAMVTFGQPSVLARQFGLLHGTFWLVFEWLAMAVPIYILMSFELQGMLGPFIVGLVKPEYFYTATYILGVPATLLYIYALFGRRVIINGVLQVFRPFRSTVTIPFNAIRKVRCRKIGIGAIKTFVIKYDYGEILLTPQTRNKKLAILALLALAPNALHPDVSEYARRIPFRTRSKRLVSIWQCGLSILWCGTTACFAVAFEPLWAVRGCSPWLLIGLPLAMLGIALQIVIQNDRSKKGVSWMILGGFLFSIVTLMIFWKDPKRERWLAILLPFLSTFPILALWWRGTRAHLVVIFAALAILMVSLYPATTTLKGNTYALSIYPKYDASTGTWLTQPEPTYASVGNYYIPPENQADTSIEKDGEIKFILTLSSITSSNKIELGEWEWDLLPNYADDTLTLAHSPSGKPETKQTEIFLYKIGGKLTPLNHCLSNKLLDDHYGLSFWSPAKTFYLLPENSDFRIVQTASRKSITLSGMCSPFTWWLDDSHLRILIPPPSNDSSRQASSANSCEIWTANVASGEKHLEYTVKLGVMNIKDVRTKSYVFLSDPNPRYYPKYIGRLDVRTGTIQRFKNSIVLLSADDRDDEFAYIEYTPNSKRLVVEASSGIIFERELTPQERIDQVTFSPDRRKMFLVYQNNAGVMGNGILAYMIYDFLKKEYTPYWYEPYGRAIDDYITNWQANMCPFQWAPDSKSMVFHIDHIYLFNNDTIEWHLAVCN